MLDNKAGYPLTKMYLNGKDLKGLFEVLLVAYKFKGPSYFPRFSGAKIDYNGFRMPFDRISDIHIGNATDGYTQADLSEESTTLYSVAATSYVAQFAWTIQKLSQGVINIVPRNENGEPILRVKDAIIDGSTTEESVQEIKEWEALLDYVLALPDTDQDGLQHRCSTWAFRKPYQPHQQFRPNEPPSKCEQHHVDHEYFYAAHHLSGSHLFHSPHI